MFKKILVLFVFVFLLMPVVAVFAAPCGTGVGEPPCSSIGYIKDQDQVGTVINSNGVSQEVDTSDLITSILGLVNWFSWFVGLVAVVMGLYSGFLFITARDNAQQITTARNTMMYAIIGIGVAIIAFSLVAISKSLLNL